MLDSLNSAVSGLQQYQTGLDVIGNNIANANTYGFKASRTDFHDTFNQTLQGGAGYNSMQVGTGVTTGSITGRFTQGTTTGTGAQNDLAIQGDGFFVVRDPATNESFATRAGNFTLDSQGYLVTSDLKYRVQGYSDAGLTTRGDVKIDTTGNPAPVNANARYSSYSYSPDGKITVSSTDGSPAFVRGQILLQRFSNPNALAKEGNNLYSGMDLAGPLGGSGSAQSTAPGTQGAGMLAISSLEMSNVDLTSEFASLITTQRAFQANARMVTTSDEVLQEVVNLKR